jgi:hypothetical protein
MFAPVVGKGNPFGSCNREFTTEEGEEVEEEKRRL